jgi:hypothetical protein
MSAAGPYRRFPPIVAGALALVAATACCPSAARAACGEYVTVVGSAAHRSTADMPDLPSPMPACHGPGCSKAPTQAAPVSAPKVVERPAPVGVADGDPVPPLADAQDYSTIESVVPSSRHPSDIFHPPRAV